MANNLKLNPEELTTILESYSEAAERLKESHDILQTEVRRLHDELASKNRQLERRKRLAALGEMAAGLAHEIRNPLGGIQLYANMLRKDLNEQPQQCDIVDKIITGVRSLDDLVTDVLALTHTVVPKFHEGDLVQIINAAIELLLPMAAENDSQIAFNSAASVPLICDTNMLQRAIINLIRNAIEAAGEGGQVMIDLSKTKKTIILKISDSGKGIEPEAADEIFNPFFTTKDTGTGLGLSIVHRIIEAHESTIKVTKASIGGAKFTLRFPLMIANRQVEGSTI